MAHKKNTRSNSGCGCVSCIGYIFALILIALFVAFGLPALFAVLIIAGVIAFFVIVALQFIGMITSQGNVL